MSRDDGGGPDDRTRNDADTDRDGRDDRTDHVDTWRRDQRDDHVETARQDDHAAEEDTGRRRDDHAAEEDTGRRRDDHAAEEDTGRRDDHPAEVDRRRRDDHADYVHTDHRDDRTNHVATDRRDDRGINQRETGKRLSALIAILGLWMLVQAVGLDLNAAQFWNDVLVGALLIGVGGYNYSRPSGERFGNTAVATIAVAAGLWLLASPFVLGAEAGATETANELGFFNDVAVGVLSIVLGAYSAYKARDHEEEVPRTAT